MLDQPFEGPLFKRLAGYDSGSARGHQAGPLVPVRLRPFLPLLPIPTSSDPAPGVSLKAILLIDGEAAGGALARYHFQSWGGTRRPEGRITNIPALHRVSRSGDLFLIERGVQDRDLYRLSLVRQTSLYFKLVDARTGGQNSGLLAGAVPITSEADINEAEIELDELATGPFEPFDPTPGYSSQRRVARDAAFRRRVIAAYGQRCAMCGGGSRKVSGATELEAAHIIPRSLNGADDVRNGLALCRVHHWAFDTDLIRVDATGVLSVDPAAAKLPENSAIAAVDGMTLRMPAKPTLAPHPLCLEWRAAVLSDL